MKVPKKLYTLKIKKKIQVRLEGMKIEEKKEARNEKTKQTKGALESL
jgi:hypothetical protein